MESRASLGVLFIHGIGQQSKGETLVTWLDPLVRWISSWLTGAQPVGAQADTPGCLVSWARLDGCGDEPAHAYVEIHSPTGGGPAQAGLLVAEAFWAKSFPPLSLTEVTEWLLETGPMTLLLHFGLQVRRAYRALRVSQGIANRMRAAWGFGRSVGGLFLSVAFLPLFLAALFLISLLRLIPIPGITQALMQRIQVVLAGVIGDTTVFSASPSRLAAILTEVRRAVAWLEPRCESMIVVAHSQGAAVLSRALDPDRHMVPQNLAGVITLGSGQRKLDALLALEAEKAKGDRGDSLMHAFIAFSARLITLYGGFALLASAVGFSVISKGLAIFFLILSGVNCLLYALIDPESNDRGAQWWDGVRKLHPEAEWLDLYASHDPVCNGAMWDEGSAPNGCVSREVVNARSLAADHTSYWENPAGFVSRVALFLARVGKLAVPLHELKPADLSLVDKEADARGMRIAFVDALLGFTWASALASAFLAGRPNLESFGQTVRANLIATGLNFGIDLTRSNVAGGFLSMESATISRVTCVVLLVLAYFSARWILDAWNAWGANTLAGHDPIDVNIEACFAFALSIVFPMVAGWLLDRTGVAARLEWFCFTGMIFGTVWLIMLHRKVRLH